MRPVIQQVRRGKRLEHAHLLLMMVFLSSTSVVVFSTLNRVVIIGIHCGSLVTPVLNLAGSVACPLRLLIHRGLLSAQVEGSHWPIWGALSGLIVSH